MKRSNSSVSSQIQLLVDRATSGSLASADSNLTASIVQFAKNSDEAPKEVGRALRKRLGAVSLARDFRAADHCLDLLEACVRSCGARFHTQLGGKRDLLDELLKLIGPKYSPPPELQDRVLHLLATWQEAFADRPDLKEVDRVVRELRAKGVRFPDPAYSTYESLQTYSNLDPDSGAASGSLAAPTVAARSTSPQRHPPPQLPRTQRPSSVVGGASAVAARPRQAGQLTPQQLGKLKADVDQVCTNCRVFNELLTEAAAGSAKAADEQLMRQLNAVNRQMQQRLMELLGQITNETVLSDLLHVNDDLNSAFLRFDRFENSRPPVGQRQQEQQQLQQQQRQEQSSSIYPSISTTTAGVNLIDLSDECPPPPSRQQASSTTAQNPGNLPDSEVELREMEAWMRSEGMTESASAAADDIRSQAERFQL